MMRRVMRHPSAWLPLAMSLAALGLVLIHVARFGVTQEADEGTAARLFQLLLAGQLPIMAFFAVKWLPRLPRQSLQVLALQALAAFAAVAVILALENRMY